MEPTGVAVAALRPQVLAHYRLAAPLIAQAFPATPIVYANFPHGIGAPPRYHVTDTPLDTQTLLAAVQRHDALEFHSWAPLPSDDDRLRFARVLLASPQAPWERVQEAALALRAALLEAHVEAIPLVDGNGGIALWIPLADAPHAATVRAWLHSVVNGAVARDPALLTGEPNTHDPQRVHVHVASNARGHFSCVPYGVRGAPGLPVCTPIAWDELGTSTPQMVTAQMFPARLASHGDVFATQYAPLAAQTFPPAASFAMAVSNGHTPEPRGRIINAAIDILGDGKARSADELCAQAIARGLVPKTTRRKYVYSALIEYIARAIGRGRKPPIVQDEARNFRLNEPPDDWPDLPLPARAAPDAQTQALCDRLASTASGADPAAFEIAVCDALAHLGFLAQHLGGHDQADGVADAILGPLGYRVVIECKSAKGIVTQPDCAEVAKEIAELHADYGVLVGPAFSDETELLSELQTHRVTAVTVDDLASLLHLGATALEIKTLLVPGYMSDVLADFLWQRAHGRCKRVADIAAILQREGWRAQRTAAEEGGPANAPRLTIDAAMLLVDEALRAAGSSHACTRDEVIDAFDYLTSPITALAAVNDDGLVVVTSP